jgi:hypothetical protein
MSIVSKLKEIVSLKEDVERRIKTLTEIELTLKYIYEKYVCDDEFEDCETMTNELRKWINIYNYVKTKRHERINKRTRLLWI